MHSFSWWRMVVRVMEYKGGASLWQMKLKYLNTVLWYYRSPHILSLLPMQRRDMIAAPLLMQNICLTKGRAWMRGGNVLTPLLSRISTRLIIHALVITFRTSAMPILSTASVRLPDYISFAFIYCYYTRSVSYNLIRHLSCDNEGCRF